MKLPISIPEQTYQRPPRASFVYRQCKAIRDRYLADRTTKGLRLVLFPLIRVAERLVFGGSFRRNVLLALLRLHYQSDFRCSWLWYSAAPPHFFDHQMNFFDLAFAKDPPDPRAFYRAFYNSEMIQDGDSVLDIGCGDGFFTKRFYSRRASHVDAIDIEPSAIRAAGRYNRGANISYSMRDAVHVPFPNSSPEGYDVVIWDSALGHFASESTAVMLKKIAASLRPAGVFAGSESLGAREGKDHLQFFETVDDLANLFRPYFKHIYMRTIEYELPFPGLLRLEACWRCSNSPEPLSGSGWQTM